MKVRHQHETEKIELEMTPMIDIVFQLLIFFIMTFKIAAVEGDFNIKMPLNSVSDGQIEEDLFPPMKVRLTADANGLLSGIQLNDRPLGTDLAVLHAEVLDLIGDDAEIRDDAEVDFKCDYHLRYEHVIQAVTAVSGYRDENDEIVKLVEKINFEPAAGG